MEDAEHYGFAVGNGENVVVYGGQAVIPNERTERVYHPHFCHCPRCLRKRLRLKA